MFCPPPVVGRRTTSQIYNTHDGLLHVDLESIFYFFIALDSVCHCQSVLFTPRTSFLKRFLFLCQKVFRHNLCIISRMRYCCVRISFLLSFNGQILVSRCHKMSNCERDWISYYYMFFSLVCRYVRWCVLFLNNEMIRQNPVNHSHLLIVFVRTVELFIGSFSLNSFRSFTFQVKKWGFLSSIKFHFMLHFTILFFTQQLSNCFLT